MALADVRSEPWYPRLCLPKYSVVEAARYAQTHRSNVGYWYYGARKPVLSGRKPRESLSYLQLVEVAFVATCLRYKIPLRNVRRAHDYLRRLLREEFPFAHLKFKTEGRHVLLEDEPKSELLTAADAWGQRTWSGLLQRFEEFEYLGDLAVRWMVRGNSVPISIDPRVAFGDPIVRGVPTWVLKERWLSGESADEIRESFCLTAAELRHALTFENVGLEGRSLGNHG